MNYLRLLFTVFMLTNIATLGSSQTNGALKFDGVDDYVSFSAAKNLSGSAFTFEFWAKKEIGSSNDFVLTKGSVLGANQYLHIGWASATVFRCGFFSNDLDVVVADDGLWHHWAVTYDPSVSGQDNRFIYRDGVVIASDESPAWVGSSNFEIGRAGLLGGVTNFTGSIDRVAIYVYAKNASQIMDNMFCETNAVSQIDLYDFNEESTSTLLRPLDDNPIYNGTLQNFALGETTSGWLVNDAYDIPAFTMIMEDRQVSPGASFVLDPGFAAGDCGLLSHSFQWYKNGSPLNGTTSPTLVFFSADLSDAGVYQLEVTDQQNGILLSNEVNISFVQFTATDDVSDRYIDIDWVIPTIPCLYDSNGDPYDIVTTRLLRDGQEIFFQTYDMDDLTEFYGSPGNTVDDAPIIGSYRDFVGPDQDYTYDLMVFVGPFGNLDPECMSFVDAGSTNMVQDPSNFMVSNDRLEEIEISWLNNSDLATSFKLFRDGELVATITEGVEKGNTISFTDVYNFNGSTSIKSGQAYTYTIEMNSSFTGQTWNYTLGNGSTLDIGFMASNNETSRVLLGWQNTASSLIDDYRLYRNNKLYAVKTANDISHIDASPFYGDSIDYQLRLIKEDTIVASYKARGYVPPNGFILGRVLTEVGQYPVKDIEVKAIRKSTADTVTTMSNSTGVFSFSGLSYGLLDSFKLEVDTLAGHKFSYFPSQSIGLSANNPGFNDALILDEFTYSDGSTQHTISLDAEGIDDEDRVVLDWSFNSNSASVILDISRNGNIIYSETISPGSQPTNGIFEDLEGIPNEETKYEIRVYDIVGNTLSTATKDTALVFPDVSRIPDGNFYASFETINTDLTGNITLQWNHTSQNIDGFRIYRNDSLIAELSKFTLDYTDAEAPFDTDLVYSITAIRKIDNTTYETELPTFEPELFNLESMPVPLSVTTTEVSILPYLFIQWTVPTEVEPNFDFTGYCIYRNGKLLRKQDRSLPLFADDFFGSGQTGITYEVSLYKATKNGMIESARVAATPVDYPPIPAAPQLTGTPIPAEGKINLTWDYQNELPNTDGYLLYYEETLLAKLPIYIGDYSHFPIGGSSHNYQIYRYKEVNGQDISGDGSSIFVNMDPLTDVVYPPQNLTATRNLPNHVKLCWEYLDFVKSEFEIWKGNQLIATLPVGSRAYYDYTADPTNHKLEYRVRAVQAGQFSKYMGAIGDVVAHKLVYGTVTDPDTKLGIANVAINRTINGVTQIVAETDSAGYYSFPIANEQVNTTFSMAAYYLNGYVTGTNLTITDDIHYEVNLEVDIPEIFPYTEQAVIEYANADVDVYDLSGIIAWQPSNSNYDGVEVTRGLNVIADIPKVAANIYEDTTAVPGIIYDYLFRTYLNTGTGKVYSDYYAIEVTYAPLEPVLNLTATPLVDQNAVQVQWSHFYDHADGYAIARNGVFIEEVLAGNPFTFTDSTGIAGEQYTYTLVAYKNRGGDTYFSNEENVTITYPGAAEIKNLTLAAPFLEDVDGGDSGNIPQYYLNHIHISWEYDGFNNNGFKVFRDGGLIATLPADSLSYKDYRGTPGAQTVYEVSAIITQNGFSSESEKVDGEILFPSIERVYEVEGILRPNFGDVIVTWKYHMPGVDSFKVEVKSSGSVQQTVFIGGDRNLNKEKAYEFIDKNTLPTGNPDYTYSVTAISKRKGLLYSSVIMNTFLLEYPVTNLDNCTATQGTFDDAVKVTWDAPSEANIDSFTIMKYRMPGNVYFDEIIVDGGKRSYLDVFSEGAIIDSFTYEVLPGRIINGTYISLNPFIPCSSLGWPGCATSNQVSENVSGQAALDIAIDNNWKAVGFPIEGVGGLVRIYKFENDQWQETQLLISNNPNAFYGASIDMSDDVLIVGEPFRDNGGTLGFFQGAAYTYRLNSNGLWQGEKFINGPPTNSFFGWDVAIDGNRFVVSSLITHNHPDPLLFSTYQRAIRVFEIPDGCQSGSCYTEIPVDNVFLPWMNTGLPYWSPDGLGNAIDIDGEQIVVAASSGEIVNGNTQTNNDGFAHYIIDGGSVKVDSIYLDASLSDFATSISLSNGILAVSAPNAETPSGVLLGGRVDLFRNQSDRWNKFQTIYSTTPIFDASFGNDVKLYGDLLAISEPNRPNDGSKLNLYRENAGSNLFDRIQSPDLGDDNFRKEFFDSGSPNKYNSGFGYIFDFSDNHIALAADGSSYVLDLFPIEIEDFIASDGTFNNTKLTWDLADCLGCTENYISSYNIYRDNELVGNVDAISTQFIDEAGNLEQGASAAIPGKEYIYEVEAVINAPFDYFSKKTADTGYSRRKGKISGDVYVTGTNSGVSGVDIVVSGIDPTEQTTYTYQTTTLSDGSFLIENMYVGANISYTITPTYLDHDLIVASGETVLLTPSSPEKNFIVIFDNTAFVISGQVSTEGTDCGISDILVNYYHTINGLETLADTTTTDENGFYSMVVNPNIQNLNEIKIQVDNVQNKGTEQGDSSIVQYDFIPGEQTYAAFNNFPVETILDFADQLTYQVSVSVENTCGNPLADNLVIIRVSSTDGCIEYNDTTDFFGEVDLQLPPKEYLIAIEGIVGPGVDNYENAGIDFLGLRPVTLDLLEIHEQAGDIDPLPIIPPVKFVYHRAVNFAFTTSFDRYLCDDSQNPAILTQGDNYSMDFVLTENHRPGENCGVADGYIIVRNSGAEKAIDTLDLVNGTVETYNFRAGLPNLVAPHTLAISLQYFSDQGSLLGQKIISVVVEGQRLLPGTGIITDALTDDAGDLQMPLLVLRDPPGDNSFASIESGSTISKSLDFTSEASGSLGFFLDSKFAILGAGAFANVDVGVGGSNSNAATFNFDITTTQSYSTSSSEGAVGRDANVIVGAGLSTQYGLTQVLSFDNGCDARNYKILGFGLGGFNSTYAYTVSFIEGLINGYRNDSILVEMDLLPITRPDGSLYTKAEAKARFSALIESWEEMLHYHDVETVPHYVLCQDLSYRDDLDANAQSLYDGWRNGFCNQIGSYQGDEFIMDEEIIWTPDLISAYNNAIAFTDEIKGLPRDFVDNGDLDVTSYDISANNLSFTNQYHNLLGNNAKTAEVFDISGDVNFTKTYTAQQSSSTAKSFSRYFYLDIAAGAAVANGTLIGLGLFSVITDIEAKIGVRVKSDAKISVTKSQAESNQSTISYTIFDNDPEDQVTFLVLQAPLQDQTPYFIRLGGLSSCPPEEALTLNQDNSPLLIDDPTMTVIIDPNTGAGSPTPPPVYDVDPGDAAVFELQMGNIGPTGLTRDARVFLDLESNPFGAIVKLGGSNLNTVSPVFSIPAGGSLTQFLTVERPTATPFYVFEGLRIGIEPSCGGEAKYITLDVYFESPCSPVSLTQPFEGFIVDRINPFISNDLEIIPYELRDFQADNPLLEYVQLQYKRLGTGTDWKNVPGGRIDRQTLADAVADLPVGQDPLYFFEWDITGEYNLYPDGNYKVRAFAFCGTSGRQYSNETEITLARSALLITGSPQPSDGRWTPGDEISVTYSKDIDCGLYSVLNEEELMQYITLVDLETMNMVPFTIGCQNNKLTIIPGGDMSNYDGHTLRATYQNITTLIGNQAQNVIWDFEVVTQQVDWDEEVIEVTLIENQVKTISTSLFNTTGSTVNGLTLSGSETWYSFTPSGTFSVPAGGQLVDLAFDGSIGPGVYTTTLQVNGLAGRTPTLTIQMNVIESVPIPDIGMYSDSMEIVLNWSFLDPLLPSTDVNDVIQVYKDGSIRGYANIEEQGNYYFSRVKVYGDVEDEGGNLDFVIWNADESQAYTPLSNTSIPFRANTVRGVLTNPEILLVEGDIFQFGKRIYVDSANVSGVQDGFTWETAFSDLQDALAVANDLDTIWMAEGYYYPAVADRSMSFIGNRSIGILGGFQNGMTSPDQRTGNNETILSGNIGIAATDTDNSYRVFKNSGSTIMMDMLTIRDGNADGPGENNSGSCLYNSGTITLVNIKMENGNATENGRLIFNEGNILIDGGVFFVPANDGVSNILNTNGATLTIKNNVSILRQ